MHNSLLVRCNLQRRGLDVDTSSPLCDSSSETVIHVLKDCSYARLFWATSLYPTNLQLYDTDCLSNWVQEVRNAVSLDQLERLICYCWCLWTNRIQKVHDNRVYEAHEFTQFINRYIAAFKEAQTV